MGRGRPRVPQRAREHANDERPARCPANASRRRAALDREGTAFYATADLPEGFIRSVDRDGIASAVFSDRPGRDGGTFSTELPGIAIAPDGTLYVADLTFGRVVRISPGGALAILVDRESVHGSRHFRLRTGERVVGTGTAGQLSGAAGPQRDPRGRGPSAAADRPHPPGVREPSGATQRRGFRESIESRRMRREPP